MFTGIIESLGTIVEVQTEGTNRHFTVTTPFAHELQIDQSVAHDGVCLTVVAVDAAAGTHTVTAINETLQKTNLGKWLPGRRAGATLGPAAVCGSTRFIPFLSSLAQTNAPETTLLAAATRLGLAAWGSGRPRRRPAGLCSLAR